MPKPKINLRSRKCGNNTKSTRDILRKKQLGNALDDTLKKLDSYEMRKMIAEASLEYTMDESIKNVIVEWSNNIYDTVIGNMFSDEEVDKSSKNMLDIKNKIHDDLTNYIKEYMVQSVLNNSLALDFESSETKKAFSKIATDASKKISKLFEKEFVAFEFE